MDNHSLRSPERSRPSKACSHRSTIWREDSVSCNLLSQSSRTPSRPSKRSSMSEEWERNEMQKTEANSVSRSINNSMVNDDSYCSLVTCLFKKL